MDYAIATQGFGTCILDCRVKNNYLNATTLNTDHRCLIQRWGTPLRKRDRHKRKCKVKPSHDYNELKNPEIQSQFTLGLNKIKNLNESRPDIDQQASIITEELNEQAKKVLPIRRPTTQNLPWRNDSKLEDLKRQRSKLNYRYEKERFRSISKLIK